MNVKTIVVATVVVCVLAAICGWCMVRGTVIDSGEEVPKSEMTQTDCDEIMGDDDLYMNIKPCYNYNGMPYNTPISFSTYQDYTGGDVSIPLHTRQRVADDNNYTLSVVIVILLIVTGLVYGCGLIYLFTYKPEEHYK